MPDGRRGRGFRPTPESRALGQLLRTLRTVSATSQATLHADVGVSQSTVQRIEAGTQRVTADQARKWLHVTDADDGARDRVMGLVDASHAASWRAQMDDHGEPNMQGIAGRRDEEARLIRSWTPSSVPALLQTDTYAEASLGLMNLGGELDVAASVQGRMQRQRILYEPGRRFEFILGEEALWRPPAEGVMEAQLERLLGVLTVSRIRLRIVPLGQPGVPPWPWFVYREPADGDRPYVTTELPDGNPMRTDPAEVAPYRDVWSSLWEKSAHDDAARALIRTVQQTTGS